MRTLPLLGLAFAAVLAATSADAEPMEPYQMVRSLQLVQDRIAHGDHAAMPMQRKLLEIIDDRLLHAANAEFEDKKNFRALLVYAMSGGNPATVRTVISRIEPDEGNRKLSRGIVDYVQGAFGPARDSLETVDPMSLAPEVGAFVALLRGAVLVEDAPKEAMTFFDTARLLSPGTLVEEAALRRSLGVTARIGDAPRFTEDARRYVSRYLHSPYASQFAEDFVSGIITLRTTIDREKIAGIIDGMSDDRARAIYLRLARRSAIDGYGDLLAFASHKASRLTQETPSGPDPRALLYSSIAGVTSENVNDIRKTLSRIDESRLSPGDRRLLDAARAVAGEVAILPPSDAPGGNDRAMDGKGNDAAASDVAAAAPPAERTPQAVTAKQEDAASAGIEAIPPVAEAATTPAFPATAAYLSAARDKLEAIDALLESSPR